MLDAKSRANFINSVGGVQTVACPNCGLENNAADTVCSACGTALAKSAGESAPAFAPIPEKKPQAVPVQVPQEPEEASAFAQGLPAWDLVPPQLVNMRRR